MAEFLHFSGIGGAGMNPLARLMAARGHRVQGSDRGFDQGQNAAVAELLRAAGISLLPQDGSAISGELDRLVHSTAVEPTTPEMVQAQEHGVTTQTRPALLAEIVNAGGPGIAVAGTSGKSTVVGMLAWILRRAERSATVLGGAALAEAGANHMGCFAAGTVDDPVVAEACESDGTLIGYRPGIGLIHNISRDHDELDALKAQFGTFANQSEQLLVGLDCPVATAIAADHPAAVGYGRQDKATWQLTTESAGPDRARGSISGPDGRAIAIDLPQPGEHNLDNACAAAVAAAVLGIADDLIAAALAEFPGVARRHQLVGRTESGVVVVDDYAHNGAKIEAAVRAAQLGAGRLIAVFQPHGFGPARFLRPELRTLMPDLLRPGDKFCYAEIFYAGGTVAKDISSRDLAADLAHLGVGYAEDHQAVLGWLAAEARAGDTVLIMGARDPRLPDLAQAAAGLL